ncbi:MAG: MBOAT family protein [Ruminococcus sp.]|nr:MBOAT family protein [Ruminococcus sp.]
MVFADLFFIYFFLPVCLICYFITKSAKVRNATLITFSLIFYAWGEPVWVSILIVSSLVDYLNGLVIDKHRGKWQAKAAVVWSLIFNLGILIGFKYTAFFVENFNALTGTRIPVPKIALPIGISFYTFQTISYTIDCYRDKVKTQKKFFRFLMYVSLFPQLIAGPIVRYSVIGDEIDNRKTTVKDFSDGMSRIILGLAKKVIIANSISSIVTSLFGEASNKYSGVYSVSVFGTWYGAVLVGLWYYFDFSGYSDMAIGMGRIFGFHFDENFKYPYICKSITEFWRRWHISLSSWFRDYVYIPMGGNRKGKVRQCVNILVVWALTGFWHGASWNFMIWGAYFGVLLLIEKLLIGKWLKNTNAVVSHLYAIALVAVGWGIFYFENFKALGTFFKGLVGLNGNGLSDPITNSLFMNNIWLFIAALVFSTPILPKIREAATKAPSSDYFVRVCSMICNVALLLLSSVLLVNTTNNPFLYFRF